jgi:drug/metabolite transporter (DMT)-like permease
MKPITTGVLLALAAAASFGITTPLIQRFGTGLGPFTIAGLLYAGASGLAVALGRTANESPVGRTHLRRLALVALFGAFIAPVLLALGLRATSGTSASLLLNLEAVFTVALGALVHREHVGRRLVAAVVVIAAGGAVVGLAPAQGANTLIGSVLVAGATLGWALDNTLSRPLSELDPGQVVAGKGVIGAALSLVLALVLREPVPALPAALGVLACGAIGYGGSLRLYLRAQRVLGSARTGSVFAVAPFLGALVALALGEPFGGVGTVMGGMLMALGVYLHLTEAHDHAHEHPALTHDHPHRHDDGHHDDHTHEGLAPGTVHAHTHTHAARTHHHAHGEDMHHQHHGGAAAG